MSPVSTDLAPRYADITRSLQRWLADGEAIYAAALREYLAMESQLEQADGKLAQKREELNHIAGIIGKPSIQPPSPPSRCIPASPATIARVLTGRGLSR